MSTWEAECGFLWGEHGLGPADTPASDLAAWMYPLNPPENAKPSLYSGSAGCFVYTGVLMSEALDGQGQTNKQDGSIESNKEMGEAPIPTHPLEN